MKTETKAKLPKRADPAQASIDKALIDLFKSNGGFATARKENLPLLGGLPLEPKVVQSGKLLLYNVTY